MSQNSFLFKTGYLFLFLGLKTPSQLGAHLLCSEGGNHSKGKNTKDLFLLISRSWSVASFHEGVTVPL